MHRDKDSNTKFEIEFYEKILEERPNFVEALKALAELYTKSGRFREGLKLDERLVELLPSDSIVYYNLACSHSLLEDIDRSFEALKKAVKLGYSDFNYLSRDPDLTNLRKDKRFTEILSKSIDKR